MSDNAAAKGGPVVDYAHMHPKQIRQRFRDGLVETGTGKALGYVQAGLAILPRDFATDFLLFCHRNPKPCSVLEVTDPGDPILSYCAPGADVRTDLPKYRVYVDGEIADEPTDIARYWRPDLVAFVMAGALTWEYALLAAGIPIRHLEKGVAHPIYVTNIQCSPAGRLRGRLVTGMLPIPARLVARAVQISSRFPRAHGAPVHIGAPEYLGIADLQRPDYGDVPNIQPGDVPVFWATTVTALAIARDAKPPLMIVHAPNYVFIADMKSEELATG
jgi:uncharacterized protein YcsI (UPF0317 family)